MYSDRFVHAEVVLEEIDALGVVLAGIAVAVADVLLAPFTRPARRTRADEAANLHGGDLSNASNLSEFNIATTKDYRDLLLSIASLNSSPTYVVSAGPSIHARAGGTVVLVDLAGLSREAGSTLALKLVVHVDASGRAGRVAQVCGTLIDSRLTSETDKARSAVADERVFSICERGTRHESCPP